MAEEKFRVYGYRWVVLIVFMLVNLAIQILWITFGAITLPATQYYGVSDLQIGLLAMIFMIVFVPLSLPIAWIIDTFGFYKAVSLGAILMAVFGLLRGVLGNNFIAVLACTIGLGVAQPFFLNSWTRLAARWFPIQERATAVGLATVANFIGIGIGLVVTPMLILSTSIQNALLIYGAVAAAFSVLFILFAREAPPTPPCPPEMESRALMLVGLRSMLRSVPFWILMWLFLVGNGIFNGLSTWIESIVRPRGFSPEQAGILGGLLLLGGIVGGIALPALSDKLRRRVPFLYVGMIGSIPGLLGLTFARTYWELMVSAFAYGFFMISLAAIGYQYAAELTYPAPEGTSNAMLTLAGQISVVFIFGMEALRNPDGSFTTSLLILTGCVAVAALLITRLPESTLVSNPSVSLKPAQPEEAKSV
ncbi:MAG TPA: MFS transporter [Anaerolineaceae bacterium]|nr:MFS transporter [Anaerolineaceae bacterium]